MKPKHPTEIVDLESLYSLYGPTSSYPKSLRMRYFDCNAPGTTGYSVATNGSRVGLIYAHQLGTGDLQFYKEVSSGFHWLYLPTDERGYLTEISARYKWPDDRRNPTGLLVVYLYVHGWCHDWCTANKNLQFTTNRGRVTLFGNHRSPAHPLEFRRVHVPPQTGTRIWYNTQESIDDRQVKYMAFEEAVVPSVKLPFPDLPMPVEPLLASGQKGPPWFFSSCSTTDVEEITLCRDVSLRHQPIIGILLQYMGGRRVSLGEFRFDRALQKIQLENTNGLHIGSQTNGRYLYVGDVRATPPLERSTLFWIYLRRGDDLDWWFSHSHCVVRVVRKAFPEEAEEHGQFEAA